MEDYMVLENPELLAVALRRGHGAIVITGHLGNWELLSAAIVAQGHAYSAYVGRQHNPIADAFVNSVRSRTGQHTIHKQAALRGMVRVIRKGEVLGLLPDQHHSRNRFFVRFFGRPVSVAPGPAQLVSHTDAALLFAETWRVGRFRYRARFRPLEAPRTSGDEEYDVLALSQLFMEALEEAIGRHPEQYFWMHRRWRPPPGEAQLSPVNRAFLFGRGAAPRRRPKRRSKPPASSRATGWHEPALAAGGDFSRSGRHDRPGGTLSE
jgi:KDO2-lipid IV(A) lauroyltransferase